MPRRPKPSNHRTLGRWSAPALRGRRIDLGNVELWADGTARLTVQKGKNQPEPATVAVTAATARALQEIRPDGASPTAFVFGLTGEALANRVHAAARVASLGDGFTGHSGRIGMVAAGAPTAAVQKQGRWKHGDMVARYTRGEVAHLKGPEFISIIPTRREPGVGRT